LQTAILHVVPARGAPFDIELSGVGLSATIVLSPGSIDFGQVDTGNTATRSVRALNTGNGPGTIDSFSLAGRGTFEVRTHFPLTVDAGSSKPIIIVASPTQVGTFTDTLVLFNGGKGTRTPLAVVGTPVLGVIDPSTAIVVDLRQNFPNPFRSTTTIPIAIGSGLDEPTFTDSTSGAPEHLRVSLEVYDMLGQRIRELWNGEVVLTDGTVRVPFNAGDLRAGSYYCVLRAAGREIVRSMIIAR
jgi:hypothetical protein